MSVPYFSYCKYGDNSTLTKLTWKVEKISSTTRWYVYCWMSGKHCRPWWDATFCSIWSGSTWFAQACLSQYIGLLQYSEVISPANFVCGEGVGGVYCFHIVRPSILVSVSDAGFFLISWKRSDGYSSVSADTLISVRCTYIRESKG